MGTENKTISTETDLSPEAQAKIVHKTRGMKTGGMVRAKTPVSIIADIILVLLVGIAALICLIPMWHILMSSLSQGDDIYYYNGLAFWVQGGFTFEAYLELFEYEDGLIWTGYLNTIIYVVGCLGIGLILNVLAGYCLSRKTKLASVMSILCIIPVIFSAGQAPTYYVVNALGLTRTHFSVIFTECTMGMYMIIGAMAFRSVPAETVESARLDGAGHIRVMFNIMLPQCFSLFMVTVLFTFVNSWNSFVGAQLYNSGADEYYPLQLILQQIKSYSEGVTTQTNPHWERYPMQFAGIIMATLPIMILLPFFQKQIESGVMSGAVKG